MTPSEREQFRLTLLRILDANVSKWGFTTPSLRIQTRTQGFSDVTDADVKAELIYLAEKGFVAQKPKAISPEVVEYQITAAGRDYYASLANE